MTGRGWQTDTWDGGDHVYVHPLDDAIAHDIRSDDCPCGPATEPVARDDGTIGWLVTHHSLDGREQWEREPADVWLRLHAAALGLAATWLRAAAATLRRVTPGRQDTPMPRRLRP